MALQPIATTSSNTLYHTFSSWGGVTAAVQQLGTAIGSAATTAATSGHKKRLNKICPELAKYVDDSTLSPENKIIVTHCLANLLQRVLPKGQNVPLDEAILLISQFLLKEVQAIDSTLPLDKKIEKFLDLFFYSSKFNVVNFASGLAFRKKTAKLLLDLLSPYSKSPSELEWVKEHQRYSPRPLDADDAPQDYKSTLESIFKDLMAVVADVETDNSLLKAFVGVAKDEKIVTTTANLATDYLAPYLQSLESHLISVTSTPAPYTHEMNQLVKTIQAAARSPEVIEKLPSFLSEFLKDKSQNFINGSIVLNNPQHLACLLTQITDGPCKDLFTRIGLYFTQYYSKLTDRGNVDEEMANLILHTGTALYEMTIISPNYENLIQKYLHQMMPTQPELVNALFPHISSILNFTKEDNVRDLIFYLMGHQLYNTYRKVERDLNYYKALPAFDQRLSSLSFNVATFTLNKFGILSHSAEEAIDRIVSSIFVDNFSAEEKDTIAQIVKNAFLKGLTKDQRMQYFSSFQSYLIAVYQVQFLAKFADHLHEGVAKAVDEALKTEYRYFEQTVSVSSFGLPNPYAPKPIKG